MAENPPFWIFGKGMVGEINAEKYDELREKISNEIRLLKKNTQEMEKRFEGMLKQAEKESQIRQKEMERVAQRRIQEMKDHQQERARLQKKLVELQKRPPVVKEVVRVERKVVRRGCVIC